MFDEISQKVIQKLQWPASTEDSFATRPCSYRIARELNVHPKVVMIRFSEIFGSGLINNIQFVVDDRFMSYKRYFILTERFGSVTRSRIEELFAHKFVEKVTFGTIRDVNLSDPMNFGSEQPFTGVWLIAKNSHELDTSIALICPYLTESIRNIQVLKRSSITTEPLGSLSVSIMNMLSKMPPLTANLKEISAAIGIPLRTVRRKVDSLIQKGALHIDLSFDTEKVRGVIIMFFTLNTQIRGNALPIENDSFLQSRFLLCRDYSPFSNVVFFAQNFSEFDEILERMMRICPIKYLSYRSTTLVNPHYKHMYQLERA
jgi:DNA-binding Lrp family transcriptional regulator